MGKVIHKELRKKLNFVHTNKWYILNSSLVLENEIHKFWWNFDIKTDYLSSSRRPDLIIINKEKRICKIVDFAVPGDHKIKLKESEKDKYLDNFRELKKLWDMEVTFIPVVIGALDTVTKWLVKGLDNLEIRRRVEIIKTITVFRSDRILRRVPVTWRDLLSLKLQWETIS